MPFTVQLPPSRQIFVYCYTNSTTQQRLTLSRLGVADTVFTGSGQDNMAMSPASVNFVTPVNSPSATVKIEAMVNGAWQESTEDGAKVEITNVGLALVSSTEVVDAHWNDAVAFFMWYP